MSEIEVKILKEEKNPDLLVVTPLLPGHKISKETKRSIKRNDIRFDWIAGIGPNNIPTNVTLAMDWYEQNRHHLPARYIMIDNDIYLGRHMLDRMYETLDDTPAQVAYTYCNFEFRGIVNHEFPAIPFDPHKLMQHNYISSNSMFKTRVAREIGLVTDDKYVRLLDWAFLLKLLKNGRIGIPTQNANFVAFSNEDDISARDNNDYHLKRERVVNDFVTPLHD